MTRAARAEYRYPLVSELYGVLLAPEDYYCILEYLAYGWAHARGPMASAIVMATTRRLGLPAHRGGWL